MDERRAEFGVEPICDVLPIAPSTSYAAHRRPPSARARRDVGLSEKIRKAWGGSRRRHGPREVWRQLKREGGRIARCTAGRLMRQEGLAGLVRGKRVFTAPADETAPRAEDLVRHDSLEEAGIETSVGSRGESYDKALAERVTGLYKTEVIRHEGPWKGLEAVEFATLERADRFNNTMLLEPNGYAPPAESEEAYDARTAAAEDDERLKRMSLHWTRGGSALVMDKSPLRQRVGDRLAGTTVVKPASSHAWCVRQPSHRRERGPCEASSCCHLVQN